MDHFRYPAERRPLLTSGCIVVEECPSVFTVEGPGADQCLQGLLTTDLIKPGPNALIYGALLTAKGMIVADYWCVRRTEDYLLIADPAARTPSLERFGRSLPPRLARLTDQSGDLAVLWLLGDGSTTAITGILGTPPAAGRAASADFEGHTITVATPATARAPFRHLVAAPTPAAHGLAERLRDAGAIAGDRTDLRVARVLSGFPTLSAEIDDKTMPAEVDFDALGGVAHDKGCYVGQETVARLHFRGHANWLLRGLRLTGMEGEGPSVIEQDGKPVVRTGTVVAFGDGSGIALAKVRREVDVGAVLEHGPLRASVVSLPFEG